jgi:hypothetical protein
MVNPEEEQHTKYLEGGQRSPDITFLVTFVQNLLSRMQHMFQPLVINHPSRLIVAQCAHKHNLEQ